MPDVNSGRGTRHSGLMTFSDNSSIPSFAAGRCGACARLPSCAQRLFTALSPETEGARRPEPGCSTGTPFVVPGPALTNAPWRAAAGSRGASTCGLIAGCPVPGDKACRATVLRYACCARRPRLLRPRRCRGGYCDDVIPGWSAEFAPWLATPSGARRSRTSAIFSWTARTVRDCSPCSQRHASWPPEYRSWAPALARMRAI